MWFLLACTEPDADTARREWMRQVLVDENRAWLARDPDAVAAKFAKMDGDVYDFLRGTAGFWYAQLARPGERLETAFLRDPDALAVPVVGDPHLENFGTCLPGEEPDPGAAEPASALTIEAVDLDAASFGPWVLDPRRAALSLGYLASNLPGCDADCVRAVAGALATGFVDEVEAQAEGAPPADAADEALGGVFTAALRAEAREAGVDQEALVEWTTITVDGRRFRLDDRLDADGDGLLALNEEERAQVDRLFAAWSAAPGGARVLDAARRHGAGVASMPAVRYYVLYDRGDDALDDDRLVQFREVVDPPALPGAPSPPLHDSNAERVEAVAATLWSRPDADARLDGLADGAMTFKATTLSGWFQTFAHEDLGRLWLGGDAGEADVLDLAYGLGRLLAAAQARGATPEGRPASDVLAGELAGRRDAWIAELSGQVAGDVERLRADAALFAEALELHGPWLGAETLGDDLP